MVEIKTYKNLLVIRSLQLDIGSFLETIKLEVSVQSNSYSGCIQTWVGLAHFGDFLNELRTIEQIRVGTASLQGLSPNEFKMAIDIFDKSGHTLIRGQLMQPLYIRDIVHNVGCYFAFEFDPSLLPELVKDFQQLTLQTDGLSQK